MPVAFSSMTTSSIVRFPGGDTLSQSEQENNAAKSLCGGKVRVFKNAYNASLACLRPTNGWWPSL